MKRVNQVLILLILISLTVTSTAATTLTWTAVFKKVEAIHTSKHSKTHAWCAAHTPTVFITTPAQIKGKGVLSLNQIGVRYRSYKTDDSHPGLSLSVADAIFSGKNSQGAQWTLPTKIFEQAFTQNTYFESVWENAYCHGFMTGYPTAS